MAPFSIQVDYFHARPPSPPGQKAGVFHPVTKGSRRQLLGRTPNIADPLSKTPSKSAVDFSQALLRDGKGAAFLVHPAAGVLMPFHTVTVEIASYSDIWGEYRDQLICKVKDLAPVSVPIRMTVVGCPLNFQMTAAFRDQQPVVRYGTHVSGVAPIVRNMRVNNPCPHDIRVDWQSFNYGQQDTQLLDLMVSYGQAFPRRDRNGEEIVPPEVKEPPRRQFETPDTLGTTPALGEVVEEEPADSPQEEAPERRKVVLVNLRPHEGQRANQPYDITPKQLVIQARSHGNIKVTFTPLHNQDVETGIDCNAFALGFMSLDSKVALSVPGKVSRVQGYHMTPLRLEMTSHVKPAQLTLEPADEEGMVYYTAASDLMQQGQLSSEFLKTTSCTVTNKTETPLQFRLVTTPPFLLVGVEVAGVRGRAFARTQASGFYTLNPRQNMKVSIAFRVSMDLVHLVDKLAGWREGDKMWLTRHGGERRLHFTQNMVIEFNNGTTQVSLTQNMVIEFNNGTTQVSLTQNMVIEFNNGTTQVSLTLTQNMVIEFNNGTTQVSLTQNMVIEFNNGTTQVSLTLTQNMVIEFNNGTTQVSLTQNMVIEFNNGTTQVSLTLTQNMVIEFNNGTTQVSLTQNMVIEFNNGTTQVSLTQNMVIEFNNGTTQVSLTQNMVIEFNNGTTQVSLTLTQNMVIEFNNGTTQVSLLTQNMVIEFNNGTTQVSLTQNMVIEFNNGTTQVSLTLTQNMVIEFNNGTTQVSLTQNMVIEFNNGTTQVSLTLTQNMVIEYNNGTTQNLPLRASLVIPSISLSVETVDFGICMVEQEREMDIIIANPTASDCYWTATIESRDKDQAFQVTPASGLLQGALSHIAQNKALLKLNFSARHSKAFECVIVFQGVLGEEVRRLQVKGHGSYDGRHEAIMDI
uniref:Deleted in lung and esophageal cancer protein 1 n=1 Tax=Branchiostoma floridae TaxID=7739 RepID=C3ZL17_BRAFL|eukprot:XP_002590688.1 hypothetical protein BRAFLDRAFT_89490 [Branchiostoma floridae]